MLLTMPCAKVQRRLVADFSLSNYAFAPPQCMLHSIFSLGKWPCLQSRCICAQVDRRAGRALRLAADRACAWHNRALMLGSLSHLHI